MSGFNLLNIGSQALLANRTALSTVSQNISNASTEGYSRQKAEFVSVVGRNGTYIHGISRSTDQFITQQYWSDRSTYESLNLKDTYISQTDNLLASSSTSISASLDTYYVAMQNAVDDPASLANRELFVEEVDALKRRFNNLSAQLNTQNDAINATMTASANNLKEYSTSIAQLNEQIDYLISRDQPVNELLDQRDLLVNKISAIVDVNVVEQGNKFNMFIGNGQPLIVGTTVNEIELRTGNPDTSQPDLYINMNGSSVEITQHVSGGILGGAQNFRDEVLNPSINELGRIALALAETTNEQHKKGLDLNNQLGGNVFNDINSSDYDDNRLSASTDNLSSIQSSYVHIDDVSKLTIDDYELIISDDDQLLVKRQPSGEVVSLTQSATPTTILPGLADNSFYLDRLNGLVEVKLDGMTVQIQANSNLAEGDSFTVQPTRFAAANIDSEITNAKQVALASPVRILTNSNNQGSGVASVEITDPNNTVFGSIATTDQLAPPVQVVFNNASPMQYSIFDVSNPLDPQPISLGTPGVVQQNLPYTAGQVFQLEGYNIEIEGTPQAGDRFDFDFNKDGVSDNRNALALSDIQSKKVLADGSMQDHYSGLIEKVGAIAASGKINLIASESVLKSTENTLASIIGVNLDEEAARLVQYQQAYSASARIITTSQELFSTLLQSF